MQIIFAVAGSREARQALRQRLVDLNLALHDRTSRFDFLETPIFLPNKISCKDNMPLLKCIGFARRERSWDSILLKKWGSNVPVLALLAKLLVSPPDEMRWSEK
jgi:hypothetical protein